MFSPITWLGNKAKAFVNIIKFQNNVEILTGNVDPTVSAVDAPAGSVYLSTSTGKSYTKTDSGSTTNWAENSAVKSVNGQTGDVALDAADVGAVASVNGNSSTDVSLDTDDISEGSTNLYFTDARIAPYVGGLNQWPHNVTYASAGAFVLTHTMARTVLCGNTNTSVTMPNANQGEEIGSTWLITKVGASGSCDVYAGDSSGALLYTVPAGGWVVLTCQGSDRTYWRVIASSSGDTTKLPLAGGTMSGGINMGSNGITNLVDPSNPQDAATKSWVEGLIPTVPVDSVNGKTGAVVLGAADVGAVAASAANIPTGYVLGPTSAGILVFSGAGSGAHAEIYLPSTGSPEEAELLGRSFLVICPTGIKNNGNLNVYGNAGNGNHLYQSPGITGDRAVRITQSQAQVWDFETVTLTRAANL